jgi:hypothetical protein
MPATAVTVNNLDHKTALVKPTPVACDNVNGNSAINGGTLILELTSSAGGTVTVSFPASVYVDGQAPASVVYTLTGAQTKVVGGFPVSYYGSVVTFTASVSTITYIAYQV